MNRPPTIRELVDQKSETHGEGSNAIINEILSIMDLQVPMGQWTYKMETVLILTKLVRSLTSPNWYDHWVDIQGYAQLVLDQIWKEEQES